MVQVTNNDANEIMWYATQARDAYPYYSILLLALTIA